MASALNRYYQANLSEQFVHQTTEQTEGDIISDSDKQMCPTWFDLKNGDKVYMCLKKTKDCLRVDAYKICVGKFVQIDQNKNPDFFTLVLAEDSHNYPVINFRHPNFLDSNDGPDFDFSKGIHNLYWSFDSKATSFYATNKYSLMSFLEQNSKYAEIEYDTEMEKHRILLKELKKQIADVQNKYKELQKKVEEL